MTVHLTKAEARRFLVNYHGLGAKAVFKGKEGIVEYFERAGAIQFDPLDVVGRNPDLVLQARIPAYKRKMLNDLLYRERKLIDHFDKQMSIHLTREWQHRRRIRETYAAASVHWITHRQSRAALDKLDEVFAALKAKGAALSSALDFGRAGNPGGWGSSRVAGVALEYLFAIGKVGIHSRRNAQKVFADIAELLPEELLNAPDPFAGEEEFLLWYAEKRVAAVGIAGDRQGGTWLAYYFYDGAIRKKYLHKLVETGTLSPVRVEGGTAPLYMPTAALDILNSAEEKTAKVRFLAPLDNLLYDRTLVSKLFDFDYSWEVYTPVVKRKYGYYVLPVLYGDKLVARFEPEHHRGGELVVKNWWWEPGVRETLKLRRAIDDAKNKFTVFLNSTYQ